jgi:hypothetical protein
MFETLDHDLDKPYNTIWISSAMSLPIHRQLSLGGKTKFSYRITNITRKKTFFLFLLHYQVGLTDFYSSMMMMRLHVLYIQTQMSL